MLSAATDNSDSRPAELRRVGVSLVIPAYNEAAVISQALNEAVGALADITTTFEVIVVDDGSRDDTAAIVEQFAALHPQVRLLRQPCNMGYGAALRTGFQAARLDLVAFTDADCQFHIEDLDYLIALAERFDVVSGYRIDRKDSSLRRFCSWGYNTLVQLLIGSPVRDIDCALKVFRRESLLKILPETNEFFANTEMFSKARELDLQIVDVGVRHRVRAAGSSKVRLTDVPRTLDALLPYWWRLHFSGPRATRETDPTSVWTWIAGIAVMLLAALILGANLNYPLIEPDEGRYAEIMREMVSTGDWLVPRLHHQPYLDKPPLFYWLGAASIKLFGPHDWAVRLVSVLAAWLTIGATYLLGRKMLGTTSAFLGALVLTLSIGFMLCGRYLILDSLLSLFVTTALFSGVVAAVSDKTWSWRMWLFSAICCALGVLTKGPVAIVLVVPPLFAHCWLQRVRLGLNWPAWTLYAGVILLFNLPWYLAIAASLPEFSGHFFWEHNVARFLTGSNHPAPLWFYLPVLLLGWMPWGGLLFPLIPFLTSRDVKRRQQRNPKVGFLAVSAIWCLAFFSISSGKLPTYIVPCFPALALLIGHYIRCTQSPFSLEVVPLRKLHGLFSKAAIGMCLAGMIFSYVLWRIKLETIEAALLHASVWGVVGVVLLASQRRMAPRVVWWTYCCIACAATYEAGHNMFPAWADQHALVVQASQLANEMERPAARIACVEHSPGSVPFYLNRDDVELLYWDRPLEIETFVTSASDVYLVVDEKVDIAQLQSTLPADRILDTMTNGLCGKVLHIRQQAQLPIARRPGLPVRTASLESTPSTVEQ